MKENLISFDIRIELYVLYFGRHYMSIASLEELSILKTELYAYLNGDLRNVWSLIKLLASEKEEDIAKIQSMAQGRKKILDVTMVSAQMPISNRSVVSKQLFDCTWYHYRGSNVLVKGLSFMDFIIPLFFLPYFLFSIFWKRQLSIWKPVFALVAIMRRLFKSIKLNS